ncbi:MAG: riboflavin synthase [Desulfobacteraceae bacterium]|nr:riboflavin synthase [Desulfobacteraceae bacterium]MBU4001379.1 riboflavin synthase [Pseudomonadota bacterium]MBU4055610.1 riboflavin synthase [Pseudomonadota bacterium]
MFTGIIEGLGTLAGIIKSDQKVRITVDADFELQNTRIGDSIAVNGVCLTAVELSGTRFSADVSPETFGLSGFHQAKIRDRVNLERALRFSDRLDGHLVSGHVDGTGVLKSRQTIGNAIIIRFDVPSNLARYILKKGSVAVDGVSLTVNECDDTGFTVSIIPHTAKLTTVGFKNTGDRVNIENDMIGKYVERFVVGKPDGNRKAGSINMEYLVKTGFL